MHRITGRAVRIAVAAVLCIGMAAYAVLVKLHGPPGGTAFDIYGYYVPIKLYAAYSTLSGGKGLLWTPFQSCGEPFFANTATGLLYPPHVLFLLFDANVAVHAVLAINMIIGGVGALALMRTLDLNWAAAIGGAVVFELGDPMAQLTGWSPMQNGSWAWVPWALFACERVLRRPNRRTIIALAAALTLEILPGWVLITALTYQLIAFRVAWELLTRRDVRALRGGASVSAALLVVPCLIAVQLIPAAEFANVSFRVGVEVNEFVKFGGLDLSGMLRALEGRMPPVPFMAATLPLAAVSVVASRQRRLAAFWLLIGLLYGVLALGPATPLYGLYIKLPPGAALIRYAHRLFWISGLSFTLLSAFAIDALTDPQVGPRARWICLGMVTAVAATLFRVAPADLRPIETEALILIVVAFALALRPSLRPVAAWLVPIAIAANLMVMPMRYPGKLQWSLDGYAKYQRSFDALRAKVSPQDRVFFRPSTATIMNLSFMHKSASLVQLKEVYDYDALLVQRLVDYYNVLFSGQTVHSVSDLFHPEGKPRFRSRLVNVAAVRYVAATPANAEGVRELNLTRLGDIDSGLELYRNDAAFARARFVPQIDLVTDASVLLDRLANGDDDLTRVAYVEEALPSGFTGSDASAALGTATFQLDDPEHLVIAVNAPARGFLFLADQFYPGWTATVNDSAVPILRANYAFRLVEVPAGRSLVEFRYRPASVLLGATISALTILALSIVLWRGRQRV